MARAMYTQLGMGSGKVLGFVSRYYGRQAAQWGDGLILAKLIPLTRGYFAVVDDWMYDTLSRFKWQAFTTQKGYTYARVWHPMEYTKVYLHRLLLGVIDSSVQVDHINRNTLDYRICNLRVATVAQNNMNRSYNRTNPSGYKGVSKHGKGWRARIWHDDTDYHLGTFRTLEEAAKAYDDAAVRLFGAFAYKNLRETS